MNIGVYSILCSKIWGVIHRIQHLKISNERDFCIDLSLIWHENQLIEVLRSHYLLTKFKGGKKYCWVTVCCILFLYLCKQIKTYKVVSLLKRRNFYQHLLYNNV